jgi:hypothetical protein
MKEVLSFFTFGIGAANGLANSAYCSTKASPVKIVHLDRSARHLAQAR